MTGLIARLYAATEGNQAFWCTTCRRVGIWPGQFEKSIILEAGNDVDCTGAILTGTPQECIAALRAQQSET